MYYYEICIVGKLVDVLTYQSEFDYDDLSEVIVTLNRKEVRGIILNKCEKPNFKTIDIKNPTKRYLTNLQYKLALFISSYYGVKLSMVLELFELAQTNEIYHQNQASLSDLASEYKNQNDVFKTDDINDDLLKEDSTKPSYKIQTNITLSQNQQKAYDFLSTNSPVLLFGDTGSGKSEIYFKLIEDVINNGGEVLFLMPEIALTMGMQKRVKKHFKDSFITWHSKLTKATKTKALNKLLNGEAKLVLGARSALFLPYKNLKLIIVDEEHDSSYKSSQTPLYNAKDLALYLGKISGIRVVLGSATPSLVSYHNYKHFRLFGTYHESKKSYIYDNSPYGISQNILEQINLSLKEQKQVIVFSPNRANFRQLECKKCFKRVYCPFCEITLSVHSKQNILKCHYCGYVSAILSSCPSCGDDMLEAQKIGTAEIVKTLQEIYHDKVVAKLDSDEITSGSKLDKILNDFNDKKIDILVGTQMISKGHDYLNVDLAVILGLDEYLFYPHYLAKEQTLSLCKQIAGRAGRAGESRVLIQTHSEAFFQKYINDYELFLKDELEQRGDYPPFSRLLYIIISDKNEQKSQNIMQEILTQILKLGDRVNVVGYGKSGVYYINSHFRHQILIKSKSYKTLSAIAKYANDFVGVKADIDPINFI